MLAPPRHQSPGALKNPPEAPSNLRPQLSTAGGGGVGRPPGRARPGSTAGDVHGAGHARAGGVVTAPWGTRTWTPRSVRSRLGEQRPRLLTRRGREGIAPICHSRFTRGLRLNPYDADSLGFYCRRHSTAISFLSCAASGDTIEGSGGVRKSQNVMPVSPLSSTAFIGR